MSTNSLLSFRMVAAGFLLIPALAAADSGVGVDTWRANKLDPTGGMALEPCDPDGTSWLEPMQHRSPSGNLYNCPPGPPLVLPIDEWQHYGEIEFGYVGTGSERYALWNRYTDWQKNQAVLGSLDLHLERPADGSYAEIRGSRVGDDDQYYQAVYGKAGAFRVEVFLRDMPNILSTDARPIWKGTGSSVLTLPGGLTPGESSSAQVAAVSAATPLQTLQVDRKKLGLSFSGYLTQHLTAYLDISHEKRAGARPYGGPFGEDWPPNIGAIAETVKPIDDTTINLNTGVRYSGAIWRADVGYSGSYYRDHYLSYSFQQPFFIPSIAPAGQIAPPITIGQMSMEPDNNYHNLHATLTRKTPLNGEVSLALSEVLMTQDDSLIPPTNCQGSIGWGTPSPGSTQLGPQNLGPQNPNLIACSQWNTTAALSQKTANVDMYNTLARLSLVLRPKNDLSITGGFKYYRQRYQNDYVAYNPLNGYYGYIPENGGIQHELGLPLGFINGAFPPNPGVVSANAAIVDGRVRPFQLSLEDYNASTGITWRASERNSFGLLYNFDDYRPTGRERDRVNDHSLKLTWEDKMLAWLTVRANYTYLRQTGGVYTTDVYGYALAAALPGFAQAYPSFVPPPETVAQLRKYDVADRTENKIDLMAIYSPRDDLTITASARADWNAYPTPIGRQGYDTHAEQISVEWLPTPATNASVYLGYDHSRLSIASVAGAPGLTPLCPNLGCAFYALENRWWESDHERNYSAGAALRQRINRATLDLSWNYVYSRGSVYYSAASASALVYPSELATMGSGFPANTYRVNSITGGVSFDLNQRVSLRVFDNYEMGHIDDWHYAGFGQGLVVGNTLYTDGGPQSYRENLVGLLVAVRL